MRLVLLVALAALLLLAAFLGLHPGRRSIEPVDLGADTSWAVAREDPGVALARVGESPVPAGQQGGRAAAWPRSEAPAPASARGSEWTISMVVAVEGAGEGLPASGPLYLIVQEDRVIEGRRLAGNGLAIESYGVESEIEIHWDLGDVNQERLTLVAATSLPLTGPVAGNVILGDLLARRGSRRLSDAVAVDAEQRTIDLGTLVLEPATLLGRVVFDPAPSRRLGVIVGLGRPPDATATFFPGRRLGQSMTVNAGTRSIRCSSFAAPTEWFALVAGGAGGTEFRGGAAVGEDIVVKAAVRTGLDVTVDLVRHPDAARLLVVPRDLPLQAALEHDAFIDRVRASARSAAVPLPERRAGKLDYPAGVLDLADGFYRVELWGLKQASGRRPLLASQAIQVAGDLVSLTL